MKIISFYILSKYYKKLIIDFGFVDKIINKKNNSLVNIYLQSPYKILILILLISSPLFLVRGIGVFDDSVYLKIGELITEGLLPYRDVFDNKPPGIYYLGALIAWIGHKHWLTSRIFLFLFAALLGCSIVKYTKTLWGNQPASFVAFLFPISYVISQGYSFHTEQFCAAFGFASLLFITKNRKCKMLNWTISGSCLGIAFMFKQVGVIYLISFLLCDLTLLGLRQISLINAIRRCSFLILGFSIVTLGTFAFIFLNGYWSIFYNDVFLGVIPFTENNLDVIAVIKFWLKTPVSLLFIPVAILIICNNKILKNIIMSPNFYELLLLFLMGFLSLLPTLKVNSNTHYLGASILALSITEAVLIDHYLQQNQNQSLTYKKISKKSSLLFTLLLIPYILGIFWISKTMIIQNRIGSDLSKMSEIRTILNKYTPPTTPVFVLSPIAPRLYYMSGRLPYTRYIYYFFNTEIQLDQATKILFTSDLPISILELPENNQTDWLSEKDLVELKKRYFTIEPSSPSSYHISGNKILILISQKYVN